MKSKEIFELYYCLCFTYLNLIKMCRNHITDYICDSDQQMLRAGYCLFASENERCEGCTIVRERRVPRAEYNSEICMRSLRSPLRLYQERIRLTDCHDDFFFIKGLS